MVTVLKHLLYLSSVDYFEHWFASMICLCRTILFLSDRNTVVQVFDLTRIVQKLSGFRSIRCENIVVLNTQFDLKNVCDSYVNILNAHLQSKLFLETAVLK